MKSSVKLALATAVLIFAGVGTANAVPLTLSIPPAEVTDPLYSGALLAPAGPVPTNPAPPLPSVNPIVDGVRDSTRATTMANMAAAKPLMPQITLIVGGAVMAHVRTQMLNSLGDPANTLGVPARMVPFN